jgi:hypothetical protein
MLLIRLKPFALTRLAVNPYLLRKVKWLAITSHPLIPLKERKTALESMEYVDNFCLFF